MHEILSRAEATGNVVELILRGGATLRGRVVDVAGDVVLKPMDSRQSSATVRVSAIDAVIELYG